jgi:hypothetical protein
MFEQVVETCISTGLVGGEGFAVDASLIQADANEQRSIAGQDWRRDRDPARSSRAVKEYLTTLNDTAWGAASEVVPKFVSPSDPAAQWTGAHKGPAFFAYSDNYLIDVKFGVIVDVEASRSIRQAEVGAARTMIERTEERFGLKPERLVADTAYGAAPMLNWLVEDKGIAPHIPVFDRSKRDDGTFSRSDFRYDPTGDIYHCPAGKTLTTTGTLVNDGTTRLYLARKHDCDGCELKALCCPKNPFRKIPRDLHEHARDVARSFVGTEGFEQSRRERKKIEMRFAPQAHPEARSASTAWSTRRPGRVCSGCHPPELATICVAGRSATTRLGSVHRVALELRRGPGPADQSRPRLKNWPTTQRQQPTFTTKSANIPRGSELSETSEISEALSPDDVTGTLAGLTAGPPQMVRCT